MSVLWRRGVVYLLAALAIVYVGYRLPGLLPGDYVTTVYGGAEVVLTADQEQLLRARYAAADNFFSYLQNLLLLDWGESWAHKTPVFTLIMAALPWTLLLMGGAHLLATALGMIAGVEAAWRRGGRLEKAGVGSMTLLQGVPELALGVVLLLVFSYQLGWLPAGGGLSAYAEAGTGGLLLDLLRHLLLPLATLVLAWFPGNFLLARASMVLVLRQPFLVTARAKGLPPWRVRYRHAARNVLLPLVTRFGLRLAFMVTGALVVETLFAYPGLGTLLYQAISLRDLPLVQGIVLAAILALLAVNLGLELLYGRLDPRTW
ncbi:binding-protein-dependent transport systems inner membrane component [Desulfurivibrio alkaliphilus AHT 2]|uniref:Binding-protein-dependent transport systems inner membrane component n=2 Tax=Desulfurivibrio alkaliphilus TaxID=427923 RepID=D6Z3Z3_DESAT|nr:binding-protein-dependent transport systems inner membrane component [Desulfurivibrio alkaliphilus AHT 2]